MDSDIATTENNLTRILARRAQEHPEKIAFTFLIDGENQEEKLSYGELDRRARQVAAGLKKHIQAGDRVLLVFPPGLDFIVGFYGCLYAGAVAVPIFPPQPGKLKQTLAPFENSARDAQAKCILCNSFVYAKRFLLTWIAKGLRGLRWLNVAEFLATTPSDQSVGEDKPSPLAVMLYTSGSTGNPQGVQLTHANIMANLNSFLRKVELSGLDPAQEKGFLWLPPYHVAGLFAGTMLPVFLGSSMVLMSPLDFLARPALWLKGISRYRAIISGGPNFAYDHCVEGISGQETEQLDLSCWKFAINGSEPVRPRTLARFTETYSAKGFRGDSFLTAYGMTEAGNLVSMNDPGVAPKVLAFSREDLLRNRISETTAENPKAQVMVSSGQVFENFDLKIVDPETCQACDPGQAGEIWLRGPSVSPGYWNKSDPKDIFRAYLRPSMEGPYLRSGDLGFVHEGELFISGRLKELIIVRGKNYHPSDLENAVVAADSALNPQSVAVFSVEAEGMEQLVVVAEVEKLKDARYHEILARVREALSQGFGLRPLSVVLIKQGTIPRTNTLKVQRKKCRELFLNDQLKTLAQWGHDQKQILSTPSARREIVSLPKDEAELENFLRKKIAKTLGLEVSELDLSRSLPSHGLDSLAAVEISHFIETNLGIRLGISPLFESPSLVDLLGKVKREWVQAAQEGIRLPIQPDLAAESKLPEDLQFQNPPVTGGPPFLTGATGFLGGYLLDRLLRSSSTPVHCLVRAPDPATGAKRIRENLEYFSLWQPDYASRILPVLGDLSQSRFGMSEPNFLELAGTIGSIYHCGANVNFIYSYWDLKPINVGGTLEAIRLAGAVKTKPLHHISTVGIFPVWGQASGKAFSEGSSPEPWEGHFSGYAMSKWVAERLVHQARGRGLPATVHRVGEVIGDSRSGICRPEKDAYSNLLKGALLLRAAPRLNLSLYFVPVDMAADAVIHLAGAESAAGKNFHIFLEPLAGNQVLGMLNDWKPPLEIKPYAEFLQELEELGNGLDANPFASFMPLLRSPVIRQLAAQTDLLKLESKETLRLLRKAKIPYPSASQALRTYWAYLEKSGFLT